LIFQVENGSFGYIKNQPILQNINFSLDAGELLAILGPNGSGKTTLLKCATGIYNWDTGDSLLEGRSIKTLKQETVWRSISYVPQAHGVVFPYSVLEMVVMGRAPYLGLFSSPSSQDEEMACKALEEVEIAHLAFKSCREISGGEL